MQKKKICAVYVEKVVYMIKCVKMGLWNFLINDLSQLNRKQAKLCHIRDWQNMKCQKSFVPAWVILVTLMCNFHSKTISAA